MQRTDVQQSSRLAILLGWHSFRQLFLQAPGYDCLVELLHLLLRLALSACHFHGRYRATSCLPHFLNHAIVYSNGSNATHLRCLRISPYKRPGQLSTHFWQLSSSFDLFSQAYTVRCATGGALCLLDLGILEPICKPSAHWRKGGTHIPKNYGGNSMAEGRGRSHKCCTIYRGST